MASKKRYKRSPHPGVVIRKRTLPSGRVQWLARFVDPDDRTKRDPKYPYREIKLDLPTSEVRKQWAIRKSKALAKRRMELEIGDSESVKTETPIDEAVCEYLKLCQKNLRFKTVQSYKLATDRFLEWAESSNIMIVEELRGGHIKSLRDFLKSAERKKIKKGGKRGERTKAQNGRSARSVNRELRSIKAMLNDWRRSDKLPQLDRDTITDRLIPFPVDKSKPDYLSPSKCKKLLKATLRHDREVFQETREEHAGKRTAATTRRYEPIAPLTAFLLLSGCRTGEAEHLEWGHVDLDAVDHDGKKIGEIRLPPSITKTHRERIIGLEVCPSLRLLLAGLKLRAGKNKYVFDGDFPLSHDQIDSARKRLIAEYGSGKFSWQQLRATTATYLTNAPSIFGAASQYRSAAQLGHSVKVAEDHYLGVNRSIPRDARTLEAAMQIEGIMDDIVREASQENTTRPLLRKKGKR